MREYEVRFTREAAKDVKKISGRTKAKLKEILTLKIAADPTSGKILIGDLRGLYSVRLSYKDRIVYSIDEDAHIVIVHRVRTHYGD